MFILRLIIKNQLIIYVVLLSLMVFTGQALALENLTKLLGVGAVDNVLNLVLTDKPEDLRFGKVDKENKITIELFETQYHPSFVFDIPTKRSILTGLDFIEDVSIGVAKYGEGKQKVGIKLALKEELNLQPYLITFEDGLLKIGFSKSKEDDDPQNVITLYNSAVEHHLQGNLNEAEKLYKKVILKEQDFFPAQLNLVKLYIEKKRYDHSLGILEDLIKSLSYENPKDKENFILIKNIIGTVYFYKGDMDKSLEIFTEIIKLNPRFLDAYFNIGLIYEKKEKIKDAISYFEKTLEINENYVPACYHLAVLKLVSKDKKEAIKYFDKVARLDLEGELGKISKAELAKLEK